MEYRISLGGPATDAGAIHSHPILGSVRVARLWRFMAAKRLWARIRRVRSRLHGYLDHDGLPKPGLITGLRDKESRQIMAGSAIKEALENYLAMRG